MNIEDLNKIKQVESPDFLFTRIQQKIENLQTMNVPKKFAWTIGVSFIVIVIINVASITLTQKPSSDTITLIESMDIAPNNTLYHE